MAHVACIVAACNTCLEFLRLGQRVKRCLMFFGRKVLIRCGRFPAESVQPRRKHA